MKKVILSIVILSFCFSVLGQTKKVPDPIIAGAVEYIRKDLKDPNSYIPISESKSEIFLSDEIQTQLIKSGSAYKMWLIYKKSMNHYEEAAIKEIRDDYELYKQYSDSIKFVKALSAVKKQVTDKLLDDQSDYERYLERNKLEGDIDGIQVWTNRVNEIKKNLANIDEYIKTTYEYKHDGTYSNAIKNYLRFKECEELISDSTKMNEFLKNVRTNTLGKHEYLIASEEVNIRKSKIIIDALIGDSNNPISGIPEKYKEEEGQLIDYLNQPAQQATLKKIVGYKIFLEYTATNTYGGRIKDLEIVYFRNGRYYLYQE